MDNRHPFPFLNNKDIYYIAQLHTKNEGISYGIVPVSSQFERVLFVKDGETTCFAFVEELIAHYAATIFSASTVAEAVPVPRDPQCGYHGGRGHDGS